jgi:hypothetical protein
MLNEKKKQQRKKKKNHPYHTLIHTFCINMAASWKYLRGWREFFISMKVIYREYKDVSAQIRQRDGSE